MIRCRSRCGLGQSVEAQQQARQHQVDMVTQQQDQTHQVDQQQQQLAAQAQQQQQTPTGE